MTNRVREYLEAGRRLEEEVCAGRGLQHLPAGPHGCDQCRLNADAALALHRYRRAIEVAHNVPALEISSHEFNLGYREALRNIDEVMERALLGEGKADD